MHDETKNWLIMVEYDLTTADHMLKSGRFVYVIFMCHLALEKALKAIICEETQRPPSNIHDLIALCELGNVRPSGKHLEFIGKINNASVGTRYPEDFPNLITSYPKEIAGEYLSQTKEIIKWLQQDKRLNP